MNVALDERSRQRVQREISRGHFREPAAVVARALELLDAQEGWLDQNRQAIHDRIEESFAQIERGEGVSGGEARRMLSSRRDSRA